MKKKFTGYMVRRELKAAAMQRMVIAAAIPTYFMATRLKGLPSILTAAITTAVLVAVIFAAFFQIVRVSFGDSETVTEIKHKRAERMAKEEKAGAIRTETVEVPEEMYAVPGRKPANHGRKGR